MQLPKFIRNNLVLKITSVNAFVVGTRLVISFFVQGILSRIIGDTGIALVGHIRNLIPMLTSTASLGVFSGVVKYVSEFKHNKPELSKLFSTTTLFYVIGSVITALVLFIGAAFWSQLIFQNQTYTVVIKFLAFMAPFIGLNRLLYSVINGLSDYKNYSRVDLIAYFISTIILLIGLHYYQTTGVLIAIALAPFIQAIVILVVFGKTLKTYLQVRQLKFNLSYKQKLLAFTLMSFVSTFLFNYIDIDLRGQIANKVNAGEAGSWTAVTFISKNYMVFASGLFTLYILPKYAVINGAKVFKKEVLHIYKTILPLFAVGMLLVYLLRFVIIDLIYPDFKNMAPLIKWQLMGDFTRLCAMVLSYQLVAKKLVKNFIFSEFVSIMLFYGISMLLIPLYNTEGVVIAHFIRNILYFLLILFIVRRYFKVMLPKQEQS